MDEVAVIPFRHRTRESRAHWVMVAAVLSLALHFALFWALRDARFFPAEGGSLSESVPFRLERVSFDARALEDAQDLDAIGPERDSRNDLEAVIEPESATLLEEQQLPEPSFADGFVLEDVVPSPVPGPDSTNAPEALLDPEMSGAASPLASVREFLEQAPVSAGQPLMPIDRDLFSEAVESGSAGNDAELTRRSPGADLPEGYADLDQILSGDGEALDLERPILMKTDLLFAFNESTLKPSARDSLMKLAMIIESNPGTDFTIEGHTDTIGSDQYNLELSKRRAQAVKGWLVDNLLLEDDRITIRAFGKTRPLVNPDGTVEQQALNRRVEISTRKAGS